MNKSDMAGGAVVAGLLYALAANHIPINNAIGLIPITDICLVLILVTW